MSLGALARIVGKLNKTRGGRIATGTGRGLANHVAGSLAKRGCQRVIAKTYEAMSKEEKWVFDQLVELSVRIASDILSQGAQIEFSEKDIDGAASRGAINLRDAIINGIQARGWSIAYDAFFGKIERNGQIVVYLDVLKQAILSGIEEVIDHSSTTT